MQYSEGKPLSDKNESGMIEHPDLHSRGNVRTGAELIVATAIANERVLRKASHSTPGDESRGRKNRSYRA